MADQSGAEGVIGADRAPRDIGEAVALFRRKKEQTEQRASVVVTEEGESEAGRLIAERMGMTHISEALQNVASSLPQMIAERAATLGQPQQLDSQPTIQIAGASDELAAFLRDRLPNRATNSNVLATWQVDGLPRPIVETERKGVLGRRMKPKREWGDRMPSSAEKALIEQTPGYKALERALKSVPDVRLSSMRSNENGSWFFELYLTDPKAQAEQPKSELEVAVEEAKEQGYRDGLKDGIATTTARDGYEAELAAAQAKGEQAGAAKAREEQERIDAAVEKYLRGVRDKGLAVPPAEQRPPNGDAS